MKTVHYLEVRYTLFGKGSSTPSLFFFFHPSENKVSGRAFSKMKLVHIDQMGVSFGSRIIIETLLEEIVSYCYM